MGCLYNLVKEAKSNKEANGKIIKQFDAKIKKSSKMLAPKDREDLEQEMKIQIIKIVDRFEEFQTPGFWEFMKKVK
ncbi:helix-turn-helix domain-containing protein [Fictibacillus nanhaiensis]|uniref:helix-turn-helix domain-containing protein n=1 Tax=Fictibacillus nanhaiensis TaxID=742169 RepID=UPI00203D96E8|nr:helix-turn-helix domain-containing protein [Fictibacillus nanhaiensis]MCM3732983.1 helix-turn-helix domain-containing protein [Fictibacillus nanhaiensis]